MSIEIAMIFLAPWKYSSYNYARGYLIGLRVASGQLREMDYRQRVFIKKKWKKNIAITIFQYISIYTSKFILLKGFVWK